MISPHAQISKLAKIAPGVTIGPWSVIGDGVEIDTGTVVEPHVVIKGATSIGKDNHFYQFSSIGEDSQDLKYKGEYTRLEIGDNNTFREFCTINRGTEQGGSLTKIGNNNLFMAYVHIAHDCIVHNNTVFSNNASLAGHVEIEDWAILGGLSGVHQFCKVGAHAFLSGGSLIGKDVPPFMLVSAREGRTRINMVNMVGLERRGFTADEIKMIRHAQKTIYHGKLTTKEALIELEPLANDSQHVRQLIDFIKASERGIMQ